MYHLQLLSPLGPSVRRIGIPATNNAAALHLSPHLTAHRFTPTLTIRAWGIYQISSAHGPRYPRLLAAVLERAILPSSAT